MPQHEGRRLLWRFHVTVQGWEWYLSAGEGQAGPRQVNGVSAQDESVTTIVLFSGGRKCEMAASKGA